MLNFDVHDEVAILNMDDGKANAVGHDYIDALNEGLDRASRSGGDKTKAVLITGRPGVFSAGFDLKEFEKGAAATKALVNKGAHLLLRLFKHPQPTVIACAGHSVAAGALMMLAADTRIGVDGEFKIGLNETAIGMSLPEFGLQLTAARLSKRHQTPAVIQGQLLTPQQAQDAGFLDSIVDQASLLTESMATAARLAKLPSAAYAANKISMRRVYIQAIEASLKD
jgi:enoyl-CoA hydratase/carnithine racemase